MNSLEVQGLTVAYGGLVAVDRVGLKVGAGEIVCVLGANGAGKSSLLNSLVGIVPVKSGLVRCHGRDITGIAPYEASVNGMSLSPEGRRLFPALTVEDNLRVGALRTEKSAAKACLHRVLTLFPRLQERFKQLAGSLSGGEQQMCAIGRALMTNPKMLLLDEPSLGLAPKVIVEMAEAVKEINRTGTSVLLVEQNAALALRISNRAYILEGGRVVLEGQSSDVLNDAHVQSIYLGG